MKRYEPTVCYNENEIALSEYTTGKVMTYGDLANEIANVHAILSSKGIRKGDKILLISDSTIEWASIITGIATYGAVAVSIESGATQQDVEKVMELSGAKATYDELCYDSEEEPCEEMAINFLNFGNDDTIFENYSLKNGEVRKESVIDVKAFTNIVATIETQYSDKRLSRNLSTLMASTNYCNALEILVSLSMGAHITIVGKESSADTIMKCVKKNRPHFINIDSSFVENLVRENLQPLMQNQTYGSSHTHRTILKQVRKQIIYGLGGCIMRVNISGNRLSPDIEHLLQKIQFPYYKAI